MHKLVKTTLQVKTFMIVKFVSDYLDKEPFIKGLFVFSSALNHWNGNIYLH